MKRQGYSAAEIDEAIKKGYAPAPAAPVPDPVESTESTQDNEFGWGINPNVESLSAEEMGLTDEDVAYLRLKWGNLYKPEE